MNDDDRDPALKTFADRIGALIETEMETTVSPDPVTVCVIVNRGDYFETVMVSNFEKPDYDAFADAMGDVCCNWAERGLIDIDPDGENPVAATRAIQ